MDATAHNKYDSIGHINVINGENIMTYQHVMNYPS